MAKADANAESSHWYVGHALAAWIVPGLGHILMGERQRGAILAVSIGLLWVSGLVIGGIGVCDHKLRPFWFAGQSLLAPTLAVNSFQQHLRNQSRPSSAHDPVSWYEPSFGHMNEQGVLYTALAGLLNLLAIFDVIYRDPNRFKTGGEGSKALAGGSS